MGGWEATRNGGSDKRCRVPSHESRVLRRRGRARHLVLDALITRYREPTDGAVQDRRVVPFLYNGQDGQEDEVAED